MADGTQTQPLARVRFGRAPQSGRLHLTVPALLLGLVIWAGFIRPVLAQETWTLLPGIATSDDTGEKPQSKAWFHGHTWWTALPSNAAGSARMWLFRLEPDNTWTPILQIASVGGKADVKVDGDLAHVLIVGSTPELVSLEYNAASRTYQLWSQRTTPTPVVVGDTATIDVDSTGRMWMATQFGGGDVRTYYSDPPYLSFAGPVVLDTSIQSDISAITALPNHTIGVFWTNQNTDRLDFRVHVDGADPNTWLSDEVPSVASGNPTGLADNHVNLAVASDGTLYVAFKGSHTSGQVPRIGLLVRHPQGATGGTWDPLYFVDPDTGTRPIVVLDENLQRLRVFFTSTAGVLYMRESNAWPISFGPAQAVMSGSLNNATSTKAPWAGRLVVLASNSNTYGVLMTPEPGLVGHWTMEEGSGTKVRDQSGWGNDGNTVGSPAWVTGAFGKAMFFNGSTDAVVSDQAALDVTSGLTVAAWIRPSAQGTQDLITRAAAGAVDGYSLSLAPSSPGTAYLQLNGASSGTTYRLDSSSTYPHDGNTWMHVAATYSGSTMRMYINGALEATKTGPSSIAANAVNVGIGGQSDGTRRYHGDLDDVRIYNRALTVGEIASLVADGPVPKDLAITKTDSVSTIPAGDPVTYVVHASNLSAWDLATGTVSDTMSSKLSNVTWTCSATSGSTCSASGTGSISDTVSIKAGGSVTYTVHATVIVTQTGSLVNTASISAPGLNDPNPSNNSATDTDTIQPATPPSINTQPANATVTAPAAANFSVAASGTAPLSYQWRRNGSNIPGATSASYTLTPTAGSDSGAQFSVVVTNPVGTATSTAATLTVNLVPSITTQPANVTVTAPAAAAFSVVATGTAPLSYQWRRNGSNIPGATSASYTLTPTAGSDSGAQFSVVVTNAVGTATSTAATLTVNVTPSITTPPANLTVTAPSAAAFSVVAAGTAPLSYQWRRNGSNIPGATSASYTLTPTAGSDSGAQFSVVVTNAVGTATSTAATLTVNVTPSITTPPANLTVTAPSAAAFSVVAAGTAPLSYQWRRNGSNIPGATSASYTLTPTSTGDSGAQFSVVVTNVAGTVTSAAATLTVNSAATPPSITTPPSNVIVTAPAPAAFSVVAAGTAPLSYQWRRNGSNIPGATGTSYTLTPTAVSDTGAQFDVVVTNAAGTVTSAAATLTVNSVPTPPSITTAPVSTTVFAPAGATFSVVATGDAPLSYQWRRNGSNIAGATSAAYTLTPTSVGDSGAQFDVVVTNGAGTATSSAATLTVLGSGAPHFSYFGSFARYPSTDDGSSSSNKTVAIAPPPGMSAGQLAIVVVTYRSTSNNGQSVAVSAAGGQAWQAQPGFLTGNGKLYIRVFWTQFNGTWSANPSFALDTGGGAADAYTLYGIVFNAAPNVLIDVPVSALDLGVTSSLSHGGISPTVSGALVIGGFAQTNNNQLTSWTSGWTHAEGEEQWRNHRANQSTFGLAYKVASAGPTGVVHATADGSDDSAAFMLAFRDPTQVASTPPSITTPPANVTVTAPAAATFSVVAAGDTPLNYQWRRNGVNISGATGASYTLTPTAGSDSGAQFDVVVTNGAGSATSAAATLTVNVAPSITTPPANLTVTAPNAAAFSVVAAGTAPLSYQWRRNTSNIPGATGSSYTLTPTAAGDSGAQFDVVVTNAVGSATSAAAALTVNPAAVPPSITTPPANVTVTAPAPAAFSVVASGTTPLSYQWRRNGANIPGATSASYTLSPTAVTDSGAQFDVVVTNSAGSATSATASLTVNPAPVPPSITTPPSNVTVVAPTAATFSVVAAGDAPLGYQWRRNGTNIPGATGASYTLTPTAVSDTGSQFSVVVTNAAGTATSAAATLTVNGSPTPPSITTPPANLTVIAPTPAAFSVVASGDAPLSYQWRRDGANIPGATSASYTLTPTAVGDSGAQFSVVVTNSSGTATSTAATLTVLPGTTPHFSYFGSFARYPSTDNGSSGSSTTIPIAPPAGMSSGQLAVVVAVYRTTSDKGQSVAVSATGGQTWQTQPVYFSASGKLYVRVFWAQFNGTWSGNPSFALNTGGTSADAYTLYGIVFNAAPNVLVDVPFTALGLGVTSSFSHSGITPTVNGALVIGGFVQARSSVFSSWTSGWTNPNGETQWRNHRASSSTLGLAYEIVSAGPTGAMHASADDTDESAAFMLAFRDPAQTAAVPPGITADPGSLTVTAPNPAAFSVVATGDAPLSYRWRRNGVDIPGATNASYTLTPTAVSDSGAAFDVVVTNGAGSATSAAATLTVNPAPVPPSISGNPGSLIVTAPDSAGFSVVATGDAPLSYQWRRNGSNVPGATNASYMLTPTAVSDSGAAFDVVVTNGAGSATSTAATLTVNPAPVPPSITTEPGSLTVTAPTLAAFSVIATGDAPLTYQWRRNGTDIPGATSATYVLDPTAGSDTGATFDVVVTNAAGTATSALATLTVQRRAGHHDLAGRPDGDGARAGGLLGRRQRRRAAHLPVAPQRHGHPRRDQRGLHAESDDGERHRRDVRCRRHQCVRHRDQRARDPHREGRAEHHHAAGRT